MTVAGGQRFTRQHPCPVCGGHEAAPRAQQERCYGFISEDGAYAHCTRDELAGGLPQNSGSDAYAHRLEGDCNCGVRHDARPSGGPSRNGAEPLGEPVKLYDYADEQGQVLYKCARYEPKNFRPMIPDRQGGWKKGLGGVRRILYRLPELMAADHDLPVFICEGEKDADRVASCGLVATTNIGGAGKWEPEYSETLKDRHVIILPHNDKKGRDHTQVVGLSLFSKAKTIKVLELPGLPEKGDVSDFLDAGHTVEELQVLATQAPPWRVVEDAAPSTPPLRFEAQSVGEFMAEEITEPDAIISDGGEGAILSPSEKIMIASPPGLGKTNMAINMAAGLAAGTGVLGLPCGQRRWNVLYVALEGNRKRLQKRVRKVLADADSETKSRFHFARLSVLDLSDDAHVQALEDLCRRHGIDVLIIDPLRDAHPWGEDKSEDAARVMRVLDGLLAALPGLAIVLIHHVRKPDTRRQNRAEQTLDQIRGSGHLVAACQSVLLVNEDPNEPDKLLADWVKHRDAEEQMAPMFLLFDRATLSYEVADRPSTVKVPPELVVTALTDLGGYTIGQDHLLKRLASSTGAAERTVRDAIREAVRLKVVNEEKAPEDSQKRKAYRLPSESLDLVCGHWPEGFAARFLEMQQQEGREVSICICCAGPAPDPAPEHGGCSVCRDGTHWKANRIKRWAAGQPKDWDREGS